ncbi:hypothetical protein GW17_00033180 [Ensete ventricosum]|nr:hypothetical protein GW17_00033180 [Ensete ventricosum]
MRSCWTTHFAIDRCFSAQSASVSGRSASVLPNRSIPLCSQSSDSTEVSLDVDSRAYLANIFRCLQANAASGMAVNDDCKLKFLELKAKRTYRFIVFKIDEKLKQVIVEKVGEPILGYDDFAACLPTNECRYAIYDFDFVTEENCQKSKIFFIAW